jgi:virulence-associated protein VagC
LEGDEVQVRQIGQSVVLTPMQANPWQPLLDSLDQCSDDFMEERCQPVEQKREAMFQIATQKGMFFRRLSHLDRTGGLW